MDADEILEEKVIEGATVWDYTAGGRLLRRYVPAVAAKRPRSSRTVHLAGIVRLPDGSAGPAPAAVCGGPRELVHVAGPADGDHLCSSCLYVLTGQAKPEPARPSVPGPGPELREWKAHIFVRPDGVAEVALNGISELLNAVIKDVPGRRWDRELRAWLIPSAWAADLSASLGNAGVEVRVTEQRITLCARCGELAAVAEEARASLGARGP